MRETLRHRLAIPTAFSNRGAWFWEDALTWNPSGTKRRKARFQIEQASGFGYIPRGFRWFSAHRLIQTISPLISAGYSVADLAIIIAAVSLDQTPALCAARFGAWDSPQERAPITPTSHKQTGEYVRLSGSPLWRHPCCCLLLIPITITVA